MGDAARRIKRETLGIGDRRKHHTRRATPPKSHAKEADTHHRLYRFRFYPTREQAEQLQRTFGACRWVYNEGLALRSRAWEQHRVRVGFAETCRALTGWKRAEETAWLTEVSSTVLQQSLRHLDQAFGRFFKGRAKHPRPKKKGRSRDTAIYVVIVDRFFPSTRRCSACHRKGPAMDVSVREWTCAECGVVHDRDVNAAVNLRAEGCASTGRWPLGCRPGRCRPR
ncbi:hypothetical protein DN402_19225 [Streptomyces sp. SW4]|nr:hypothetical protein DN402_19225 [Streptomyces sp. SW4]